MNRAPPVFRSHADTSGRRQLWLLDRSQQQEPATARSAPSEDQATVGTALLRLRQSVKMRIEPEAQKETKELLNAVGPRA